jgi:hypothetical protein
MRPAASFSGIRRFDGNADGQGAEKRLRFMDEPVNY